MNWNGGALSRSRHKTKLSLSAAQMRYFAKAQAQSQRPRQFKADLEFSTLEHARKEELDARKRSPPSPRVDYHEGSSISPKASLREERAVISPSSSSSPAFPISYDYKKDDSLEDQKRKLLAMNDWCGLKKPLPVEMVSTSTDNMDVGDGRIGYKRVNKRRLSDSSEAYSPLEGLTGMKTRKTPQARNLHNAEENRHRAYKRQQLERRISPLDSQSEDGSESESSSLHKDSPFGSALGRVAAPYIRNLHNVEEKRHRANKRQQSEFGRRIGPLDGRNEDGFNLESSSIHRDSPFCNALERVTTPYVRNLHNAEENRHRANKCQQLELRQRIGPLDGRREDGSEPESSSLYIDSPFGSALEKVTTPYASHYYNSDENLFADEPTKSQPLFQPSPLRSIVYDWSDIKSDAVLSAGSPLDAISATDSPTEIELKMVNHHRHPRVSGLRQVRSTISSRLPAELTTDAVSIISRDSMSQIYKSGLLKKATYIPVRPELNSENITRFLLEHDNVEPIYQYPDVNVQPHSAESVEIAATDSIEYDPGAQEELEEFCTPSRFRAQSNLCVPTTAVNFRERGIATGEPGAVVAGSLISRRGTIGDLTSTTMRLPTTINDGESLSPDSGWKDFVKGSANGEISDISPSIQRCVNSQQDPQSPNSGRDKEGSSPPSSPHQFDFLYSEPSDKPAFDQHNPHKKRGTCSPLSSPHRFSSISSDQSTNTQSAAHAASSLPDISREIPFYSPGHPSVLRDQVAPSHGRESTEELEQPAECFVKPALIFTKPARFVGERVGGVSSSTETGEHKSRSIDSSLGQAQPEWRPEEEEVEDIED